MDIITSGKHNSKYTHRWIIAIILLITGCAKTGEIFYPDRKPPQIELIEPVDANHIWVFFNEQIDTTIETSQILITNPQDTISPMSILYDSKEEGLFLTIPTLTQERHTLTITGIADTVGNIGNPKEFFLPSQIPDTTPPVIIDISPHSPGTNIKPESTLISITFNEAIDTLDTCVWIVPEDSFTRVILRENRIFISPPHTKEIRVVLSEIRDISGNTNPLWKELFYTSSEHIPKGEVQGEVQHPCTVFLYTEDTILVSLTFADSMFTFSHIEEGEYIIKKDTTFHTVSISTAEEEGEEQQ